MADRKTKQPQSAETVRDGVTIEDIAKRANVSKSTVSRVLNGSAVVNHQKQAAVHQAVIDLNYTPNMFAQGLASGKSMTLGILKFFFTERITANDMKACLMNFNC
jgi:DNA-binding LacI/PurR family transcriptional regulator